MKLHTLTLISGLILSFACAQNAPAQADQKLTFTQYAAKKMTGRAGAVDLKSHPRAGRYRTRLRDAARGGVNFAGRFIIATWGCGSGCAQGAVIDAKTGDVYFPRELGGYTRPTTFWKKDPLEYRPNSRLLILHGKTGADDAHEGIYHLEWTGKAFKQIRFRSLVPQDD